MICRECRDGKFVPKYTVFTKYIKMFIRFHLKNSVFKVK